MEARVRVCIALRRRCSRPSATLAYPRRSVKRPGEEPVAAGASLPAKGHLARFVTEFSWAGEIVLRLHEFMRRSKTKFEKLDLNTIVEGVELLVRAEFKRVGARLILNLDHDLAQITGDRIQLELVLLNLLRNGLDAVSADSSGNRIVRLSTHSSEEKDIGVTAENTGERVSDHIVERMFDAFFTTKPEGMGIGLSLSRSIIESHGGRVWAVANPEGGLAVSFSIPSTA